MTPGVRADLMGCARAARRDGVEVFVITHEEAVWLVANTPRLQPGGIMLTPAILDGSHLMGMRLRVMREERTWTMK